MQLFLASTPVDTNGNLLGHCRDDVKEFLDDCPRGEVLMVPYASLPKDWDEYISVDEEFFRSIGHSCRSIHTYSDPVAAVNDTTLKAIVVWGGNTFLLIKTLQDLGLIEPIQQAIKRGVGYIGTSAGAVIACPTMQTTNDTPIVQPRNFTALNLIDFQINPHFVAGRLLPDHQGETREDRIEQYIALNGTPVIGLPEPAWIQVDDKRTILKGSDAIIFEKDLSQKVWTVNTELKI